MKYIKLFEELNSNILDDIYSRLSEEDKIMANDDVEYYLSAEKGISIDENDIIEFYTLDEDQRFLIGDNPVKLYHLTSKKFKKSILENGLQTGHTRTNPIGNSYSGIYLTTVTSGAAIEGYKHHIRKHGEDIIIIELKMYMNEIEPDPDDADLTNGKTQFITGNISPDRILNIEETY